jgi:hypothetical protein
MSFENAKLDQKASKLFGKDNICIRPLFMLLPNSIGSQGVFSQSLCTQQKRYCAAFVFSFPLLIGMLLVTHDE